MKEQIERFFEKQGKWKEAYILLREIVLEHNLLEEEYKWMHPCYTFKGKNVLLIHGFKEYCALLFHKGVLLNDSKGVLIQQTENVQSGRQLRFVNTDQIIKQKPIIKNYIKQAIEIEKSGRKVEFKNVIDYPIPIEFQEALSDDIELYNAFYALSPGRQKGYLFYFNQAKQSKTRQNRIEKYYQQILEGKGIND